MRHVLLVLAVLAALALPPRGVAAPPPGATARCRDGTYSHSRHHAGTCSHHGGVAAWLDGSPSVATGARTTPATPAAPAVGATVLVARRTRSSGCRLGPNPDRRCSPGAYYSKLTAGVICSPAFRTGAIRDVPESEKHLVEREYGLEPGSYGSTLEIDHIVSLELGGSNDVANLYPEEAAFADGAPGFRVKDRLENRLHDLVCAGRLSLRTAQRRIAADWQALYRQVFDAAPAG